MVSAGFQWGIKPPAPSFGSSATSTSDFHIDVPRYTPSIHPVDAASTNESNIKKRRLLDDESNATVAVSSPPFASESQYKFSQRKVHSQVSSNKFKKSKTPKILGQTLPVTRLIEVLDQKALQNLLLDLVQIHPEIASTIHNRSPKPTVQNSLLLLKEKFQNIISHLPYKCDIESDYSYLRVKSHLNEFLNCLSDFILHFLPPIETNTPNSLIFLDHITDLIHELPNFTNNEFQYTRQLAYEQIANAWFIVLNQKIQYEGSESQSDSYSGLVSIENFEDPENSLKLIKIIEDLNLQEKLEKHNEQSNGKFKVILEFIKSEINLVEMFNNAMNNLNNGADGSPSNVFGDLITVDYSKFSISARTSH
ncbi:tethering factor for nuclear proteasome STS1 [Suhomyces tanzawaensis NRRL Y-17324]|uniref:Tethering factor for nuclear proteasome STS1 n=1 Tax=Suhomyces tanzawaensis NRRL Y-17324 TaxID=984487 RepID=A0A1E4SI52_9ASCO|nr:tethering factor for nuclear proteasome STS1 [Suhomyces tanzawaensis NRRL Y-17324]ODV79194.1 tethering factor for nuclear proteasome STS1 [Suhomyces tanzawaensis NRRL Y-17324]